MAAAWDVSDTMLKALLDALRANAYYTSGYFYLHLYLNAYAPVPGTVLSDFTECTFAGYASQNFNPSTFGSATVAANVATALFPTALTFTASSSMSGSQQVYGYYVTDSSSAYAWSEEFATPFTIAAGASLQITPRMKSETGE